MDGKLKLIASLFTFLIGLFSACGVHANSVPYRVATEADDVVTRVLFDALSTQLSIDIEYVNYPSFDAILNAVETGDSDFAANVTFTETRALRFSYSAPTNIEYTYLYSRSNSTLEQISVVGVPKGTIYGDLIQANYPHIKQVQYDGFKEAKVLLEKGLVEGVVDAINQLKPMLLEGLDAQLLNHQIMIKPVSIISPKGEHVSLLGQFEEVIHSAQIQQKLRESIEFYQFTIRQQALRQLVIDSGLNVNRTFYLKLENLGLYAQYMENGEVNGVSADIVFEACKVLLLNCKLSSEPSEIWETMYRDLVEKQIDILTPITISEHRKRLIYFSDPYYETNAILVKREGYKDNVYSNISELIVENIGVVEDDFYEELLAGLLPNKSLYRYDTQEEQIQALLDGQVDYIAVSEGNFNRALRESSHLLPLVADKFIGHFYTSKIAIGFPKNKLGATLAPLFSRALKMINTEKIIQSYDFQPNWKATLQAEQRYTRTTQITSVVVFSVLAILAFYLHSLSTTDNLTSLKNRRALHRKYRGGVGAHLTLIYLDVNNFKKINDSYGHEVGDEVLRAVSERIKKVWKGNAYRIGGDEFILVGRATSETQIQLQEQLASIAYQNKSSDVNLNVSVALGISTSRTQFMSLQEVLNEADKAMYDSKREKISSSQDRDFKARTKASLHSI